MLVAFATVVVAFAVGLWALNTQWAGWHVRKCGFDSHGFPYAVVRDNTIGGAKHEQISVQFADVPHWNGQAHGGEGKDPAASSVSLRTIFGHAIGGVTTVVHGTWPTRELNGPQKLYCTIQGHGNNDYN